MKTVFALAVLMIFVGCSKPQVVGRVVFDDSGNAQVDFGNGRVGGCFFDNDPKPGDDVVISDPKSGTCHAILHKGN